MKIDIIQAIVSALIVIFAFLVQKRVRKNWGLVKTTEPNKKPVAVEHSLGEIIGKPGMEDPQFHKEDDPTLEDAMAKFINEQ